MVLSLGEAHVIILLVTILIWEDNHEVLAREIFLQFVRQTLQGILVRNRTFTGGDNDKQVVFLYSGSQLR